MQNAPIEKFTALLGTTFVNLSVFMSQGNFRATFGQPVRTSCTCSNLRFEPLNLRFETFRFSEPPCARFEPHCEASRFEVEPLNLIRFETLVHYRDWPMGRPPGLAHGLAPGAVLWIGPGAAQGPALGQ